MHKSRLRLSVVLATYNGANYLPVQLDSLLRQTRLPDELLVSDDGSTDGTIALLEAFADAAPFPVHIHRQEKNLGAHQNFAMALTLADGDVLLCCDQDDRWHPDKLEQIERIFRTEPTTGLVLNDALLVDGSLASLGETLWERWRFDAERRRLVTTGQAFGVFAWSMPPYGCTMAIRADLREYFLPIPTNVTFDSWIGEIVSTVAPVRLLDEVLQVYRQHEQQVTGFVAGSRVRKVLWILRNSDTAAVAAEVGRLAATLDRLGELPLTPERVTAEALVRDRLRLDRSRLAARRSLARRVPIVARALLNGSYRRSARGALSAAVDLLARPQRIL